MAPCLRAHLLLLQRTWLQFPVLIELLRTIMISVPGDPHPLFRQQACVWCTYIHADEAFIHTKVTLEPGLVTLAFNSSS